MSAGKYLVVADALDATYGYLFSSDSVLMNVLAEPNQAPVTKDLSPEDINSPVGYARQLLTTYEDPNGADEMYQLETEIRSQAVDPANGKTRATRILYNRRENKIYLMDSNGVYQGGIAPKTSGAVLSNDLVTVNCELTETFTSDSKKQVFVSWNIAPSARLLGTNNVNLDVHDHPRDHSGFVTRGTWTVYGSSNSTSSAQTVGSSGQLD